MNAKHERRNQDEVRGFRRRNEDGVVRRRQAETKQGVTFVKGR